MEKFLALSHHSFLSCAHTLGAASGNRCAWKKVVWTLKAEILSIFLVKYLVKSSATNSWLNILLHMIFLFYRIFLKHILHVLYGGCRRGARIEMCTNKRSTRAISEEGSFDGAADQKLPPIKRKRRKEKERQPNSAAAASSSAALFIFQTQMDFRFLFERPQQRGRRKRKM